MMGDVTVPSKIPRDKIVALEQAILKRDAPVPELPLKHHFAPSVYGREILLPKDSLVIGKIHKHAHLNMIMQGHVTVATEDGITEYHAPVVMVSKAGTKRVVYAHEDTIWVTVHPTDSQDLEVIENEVIAKSYAEYDEFKIEQKETLWLGQSQLQQALE